MKNWTLRNLKYLGAGLAVFAGTAAVMLALISEMWLCVAHPYVGIPIAVLLFAWLAGWLVSL